MKKILLMITAAASLTAVAQTVSGVDYEDGMFLLNEGAYGHVHIFVAATALWCIVHRKWRMAIAPNWE